MKAECTHTADRRFENDKKQKYKQCNSTSTTSVEYNYLLNILRIFTSSQLERKVMQLIFTSGKMKMHSKVFDKTIL